MGWDANRPVPWQRLIREWLLYAGIMAVVFLLFFRDSGLVGILAGLFVSGPLYVGFGAVLAKFGYQRKTLKELRTPRATPTTTASTATARTKPAPTRRTTTGPQRRPSASSRKRR